MLCQKPGKSQTELKKKTIDANEEKTETSNEYRMKE